MFEKTLIKTNVSLSVNPHDTKITPVSEVTVFENKNISITCTSTGKPAPNLMWYKDDNLTTGLQNGTHYLITHRSVFGNETVVESILSVVHAVKEYSGNYTCKAASKFTPELAHKTVIVYCKYM